jgi:hypothetical protein
MSRRKVRPARLCACGCKRATEGGKWLAEPCFRRLPFDQRRAIAQAGQEKAWHQVGQLAQQGARWLQDNPSAAEAARRAGAAGE